MALIERSGLNSEAAAEQSADLATAVSVEVMFRRARE